MFRLLEKSHILFCNLFGHVVYILFCHFQIIMSQVIPYSLYGYAIVIKHRRHCMAVIMGLEQVIPAVNLMVFAELFHLMTESHAPVRAAVFVRKQVVIRPDLVGFDINFHDPIQALCYGNPLIILHLYLIHLNPGIMVLAIIGISLQGTYLADPQAQTPEMEVHAAKVIREQMQLTQHFFADLR